MSVYFLALISLVKFNLDKYSFNKEKLIVEDGKGDNIQKKLGNSNKGV